MAGMVLARMPLMVAELPTQGGHILSFIRLYAVGLASAILANLATDMGFALYHQWVDGGDCGRGPGRLIVGPPDARLPPGSADPGSCPPADSSHLGGILHQIRFLLPWPADHTGPSRCMAAIRQIPVMASEPKAPTVQKRSIKEER